MKTDTFDITTIGGLTTLHVESDRIDDCLAYYRAHKLKRLSVNWVRGYKARNVDFLRNHPYVTDLEIIFPPAPPFDVSGVEALADLRFLFVSDSVQLRLGQFPKLEVFRGPWDPRLDMSGCNSLTTLTLRKYKSKAKDLTDLPAFPALQSLDLVQSALLSLRGIERYAGLKRLELAYLTKLESLTELVALSGLEVLVCDTCRKLRQHEAVSTLKNLRTLKFNRCSDIPSLGFLDAMPNLEELYFVGTNVVSGDLQPALRLRWVVFDAKRHYSHSREEMDAILRPKGGGAIPRIQQ